MNNKQESPGPIEVAPVAGRAGRGVASVVPHLQKQQQQQPQPERQTPEDNEHGRQRRGDSG
jgi:hypothetical protein